MLKNNLGLLFELLLKTGFTVSSMYYPDSREPCKNFSPCSSLSNTGTNLTLHLWDFTGGEYRLSRSSKLPVIWSFWKIRIIYHECKGRIEKSLPRIVAWHHEACQVMTNGDPRDGLFYPALTQIMDSFSCSPQFLYIYFKISFQKSLNTLKCNFT